jgi:membrane-associated phospholipid phosphatase
VNLKKGIIIIWCCLGYLLANAQSPYNFNTKKDIFWTSGSLLLFGTGQFIRDRVDPFTIEEINALNAADVNSFDRPATENWSTEAAHISDYFLYGSFVAPALLAFDKDIRKDLKHMVFMYFQTGFINSALTEFSKSAFNRVRPLAYNLNVPLDAKTVKKTRLSFFSGHTSNTTAYTFLTAKIFSDYSDDKVAKALVWTGAIVYPAVTGYLRVKSGKHFPTDVIAGYAVGASIGFLVPHFHKHKKSNEETRIRVFPYSFGKVNGLTVHWSLP